MRRRGQQKGFTLLELLLVMAIASTILVAIMNYTTQRTDELRRDRAVLQTEQILNAGLAYYVGTSAWPTNFSALQTAGYLPSGTVKNPWQQPFMVANNPTTGVFYACSTVNGVKAFASASILAGRLPMAKAVSGNVACGASTAADCAPRDTTCTVIASVNIPGQNLNNARSINFAGIYHPGQCVASPRCPPGMSPQIMITPISVIGVNSATAASPLTGFTAYAVGDSNGLPVSSPYNCAKTALLSCISQPSSTSLSWRACLRIDTSSGVVVNNSTGSTSRSNPVNWTTGNTTNNQWASQVSLLAMTRCSPSNESIPFSVYGDPYSTVVN